MGSNSVMAQDRSYINQEFPARAFLGSSTLLRYAPFEMQSIAVKRQ